MTYDSFLHPCLRGLAHVLGKLPIDKNAITIAGDKNIAHGNVPVQDLGFRHSFKMSWGGIIVKASSRRTKENLQIKAHVTFDQFPSGSETCKRAANRIEDEPVVYVLPNGRARRSSLNTLGVTAFMSWTMNIAGGD